ncbi:hypothetical protein PAALTS15_05863 [Paenibacillus alvei TS-15]|uniref:Uncharacterized protein n=1 Tax=Paenibacillus alvei TS-15 TaxID=1117108 RepID=S9SVR5_PAEAL|nr:hypothetical protein [Paenibacillus alvei]EPY08228.1 hypothetical protein PAALTS15_05863 [Paenibacillus alvei TS-15]
MNINIDNIQLLRKDMLERLYYLQLASSITNKNLGGIMNPPIKQNLIQLGEFIVESSDSEFAFRSSEINDFMFELYRAYKLLFKPKINQRKIGRDFNELFSQNQNPYIYGIEFGWIDERIEYVQHPWPKDLPYQARIGIGPHFPAVGIEEEFMLRDAFFFLVKALEIYNDMHRYVEKLKRKYNDIETRKHYLTLSNYNQTVASYSRLGTQSFYFFTEAFINSVGYDYLLRNKNELAENEIEILQGKNKGRFIPLEHRIQKFQTIIRTDNKIIINTTDESQIKEPFTIFLNEIKAIRDAASHFTPVKGDIWYKPEDWIERLKLAAKICLEVSKEFWKACYPHRDYPVYLMGLSYEEHVEIAKTRIQNISLHETMSD